MRMIIALAALTLATPVFAADQPQAGEAAPEFRLQDQKGDWHTLDDYAGQWVVMYFYPKDDTPGCTTEACEFRDDIFKFKKMNVAIIGVSIDDVESHAAFAEKYHLPFPLLADMDKQTAKDFGVLSALGLYANRETFVIDPEGRVARHYKKVDAKKHSMQLQDDVALLMSGES